VKILWLSHLIPYPPKGGVLQRSFHLINELAKYHQVDLLAFNQRGLIAPLYPSVEQGLTEAARVLGSICHRHQFFEIPAEIQRGGKYWLALRSLITAPYNINWLRSKEFADVLTTWVQTGDYDLIHFDTISLIPFSRFIPRDIPKVLDHHNIESHMLLRRAENEINLLKKIYFLYEGARLQRYEQRECPRFELNITCSDTDSDRLKKLAPACAVTTIPNGVDIDYFKPGIESSRRNRLIFVGTMSWYPNIDAVLYIAEKLWGPLKNQFPDLQIDIVGANPPAAIKSLEATHPGFHVHGFVDDVRPYIGEAAIYICPIRDGGGTKLKILDAMAMAKALIAHPIACEGIAVTPHKDVLFAETPAQYVEHVGQLLKDSEKRAILGANARQLIESSYSYTSIGKQLSQTYENVASKAA
jgi:glycosyltransferase involved in cell wall biosynthesis